MNSIERLKDHLLSRHPTAKADLVAPLKASGFWSLDIDLNDVALSIQWRDGAGFDLSVADADSYGEGADEHLKTFDAAAHRIEQLLIKAEIVSPPINVLLSRLREQRGVTQQQIAASLGLKQASISGIERRGDIQLSTLRKFVEALGGTIEIFVRFREGQHRLTSSAIKESTSENTSNETKRRHTASRSRFSSRTAFQQLSAIGTLSAAELKADQIRAKKSVFEMY